jgi:competence protein ComFC
MPPAWDALSASLGSNSDRRNVPPDMVARRYMLPPSRDLLSSPARRVVDSLLNLVFPESCLVCSAPISRLRDRGVCEPCWQKALRLRLTGSFCPSCGLPYRSFEPEPGHLCGVCSLQLPPFSGARAFGCYGAELSRIIQAFKFDGRRNLVKLLAPLLASTFLESWTLEDVDLIVPVPLHPKRRRKRGYNQAALLAHELGHLLGLPSRERVLLRVLATPPQVGLSDTDRARNVKHAFRCVRPDAVRNRRILLIDDVMTTGATLASASESLMAAGAMRVCGLTVARAVAGWE